MIYHLLTAEDHLIEALLRVDYHVIHSLLIVTVSIVIMAVTWLRSKDRACTGQNLSSRTVYTVASIFFRVEHEGFCVMLLLLSKTSFFCGRV